MNYSKNLLSTGLIILFSLLVSCNSNSDTDIIPREEFINILTELHLADAILTEKGLYDRKLKDSTDSYYNYILVKYNMSRNRFDNSLMHYSHDMKDFSLIYDKVIENITTKNEAFKKRKSIFNAPMIVLDSINLAKTPDKKFLGKQEMWTKKKDWSLPKDGRLNIIKFEKVIYGQSRFELSADIMLFKNDQTIKPTMLIYIFYKDESHDTFTDTTFVKDEKWHTVKLTAKTNVAKIPSKIICKIINHGKGTKSKHLDVKNISLMKYPVKTKAKSPKKPTIKKKNINIIKKSK